MKGLIKQITFANWHSTPLGIFLRQSGLVLAGQLGAAVFAYGFSILAARWLGPVEFGVLGVASTLVLTLNQVSAPLALVVTNASARLSAAGQAGQLRHFVGITQRAIGLGLMGLLTFGALAVYPVSVALHVPWLTLLLALAWFAAGLETIFWRAVQQGLQAYSSLSINLVVEAAARLLVGWLLLVAGRGANGAIVAYGAAAVLAVGTAYLPLRAQLNIAPPDPVIDLHGFLLFSGQAFAVTLCYAVLTSADFLAVKRFLPEAQAGLYAAMQMFGKLAFTGFSALYTVMFSAVSHDHAQRHDTRPILWRVLGLTILLGSIAVGLTAFLARQLIAWTVGKDYMEAAPILTGYLAVTVMFAVIVTLNTFYLARREGHFLPWLAVGAGLLIFLLAVNHNALEAIVLDLGLSYGATLAAYSLQALAPRLFSRT